MNTRLAVILAAALLALPSFSIAQPINQPFNPAGQSVQLPGAPGELRVSQEATQLFQETFDTGTLDTALHWTATTGGTGVAASNAVGATILDGGTTLNSFSLLASKRTYVPTEPGYIYNTMRINIESPVVTTAYRVWGLGTFPGSPSIAAPVSQCVCWEIGLTGKLAAVTYQTGTRVLIADLSAFQPTDNKAHKYFIFFRGDQTFWAIDSPDFIVASFLTGASGPDINALNVGALVVSNSGTHATIQLNAAVVSDTARNGINITPTNSLGAGFVPVVSGSAESSHVCKPAPGNLYGVYATNLTGTAGFLLVLNATSAPVDGAVLPVDFAPLPANGSVSINYSSGPPTEYLTGITAVVSSAATIFTKTTGVITAGIRCNVR